MKSLIARIFATPSLDRWIDRHRALVAVAFAVESGGLADRTFELVRYGIWTWMTLAHIAAIGVGCGIAVRWALLRDRQATR